MSRTIFINLPVADLPLAREFYCALGFVIDEGFSNDEAACVIVADHLRLMLLTRQFFARFTARPVADAHTSTEVLLCLSCDSRAEVDGLVGKAVAAGGLAPRPPQDHGFMYGHGFEDPDGHIWELVHMQGAPGTR